MGDEGTVSSVVFHPTLPLLATSNRDNFVRVWILSSDKSSAICVKTLAGLKSVFLYECVFDTAFHPILPILAIGSRKGAITFWNPFSDELSETPAKDSHLYDIYNIAFHHTLPILATGSRDGTAKLWRFSSKGLNASCMSTLTGHTGPVYSVAFHPTELLLATGADDETMNLWRFSPDGSSAICGETRFQHMPVVSIAFNTHGTLAICNGSNLCFRI